MEKDNSYTISRITNQPTVLDKVTVKENDANWLASNRDRNKPTDVLNDVAVTEKDNWFASNRVRSKPTDVLDGAAVTEKDGDTPQVFCLFEIFEIFIYIYLMVPSLHFVGGCCGILCIPLNQKSFEFDFRRQTM